MAKPTIEKWMNGQLHGPEGSGIPPIGVLREDGTVITCWQLSKEELFALVAGGGKICVSCLGKTQPPMQVFVPDLTT